jgi:HEAT repeat protein
MSKEQPGMIDEGALMRIVVDQTRPVAERATAAEALGRPTRGADYEVWRLLCGILQDSAEDSQLRIAAAHALSRRNRAAAPNQLCRYLEGDEDRLVRAEVVAILSAWGSVPERQESRLRRDLDALQGHMTPIPLLNLALNYGGDPRVVATLQQALHNSKPELRHIAQRGLGMLGSMADVLQAIHDEAPQVRAGAAETLGLYSLKAADDIAALEDALIDADASVQRAAKVALRRLGAQPTPKSPEPPTSARASHTQNAQTAPPASPGSSEAAEQQTDAGLVVSGMDTAPDQWRPLLKLWSRQWLDVREYAMQMPDDVIEAGWLGYPGASDQALQELEQRLQRTLPPSYRAFLQLTNGWRRTSPFIDHILPAADVDYFHARNQDWIDILLERPLLVTPEAHARYGENLNPVIYRAEYLPETIQVSEIGDAAVYLLNPAVVTAEGEWEAWFLTTWLPGARRYPTFGDLLQAEYASFVRLQKP